MTYPFAGVIKMETIKDEDGNDKVVWDYSDPMTDPRKLSRIDIIRLAREACSPDAPFRQYVGDIDCGMLMRDEHLERFAAIVAAAEREACAKVCDELVERNRADAHVAWVLGNSECAAAIRARGNTGIKWEVEP